MTSPVDIRPDHLEIVQRILRGHLPASVKVWVFGSRANWNTKDASDLDLALESDSRLNHKLLGALKNAFEDSTLPYTVDVVDLDRIGDSFRQVVESQRVTLPMKADGTERQVGLAAPLAGGPLAEWLSPGALGQWNGVPLGDVCIKIGSGATPRGGRDVYLRDGPYTLIRSQNIYNDGFHRDGLAFIGQQHADELQNVEVLEGDVLLNITGDSVARACQVAPDVLPARVNQHVAIIRPDSANLDADYLRYYLVAPIIQTLLLSWAGSGGTRNALTKGMIEWLEVPIPPLREQRAIAHVLGTLDDKIELNRRMNETLEAMARALFKSWFVDFDPVRAKMEGRWRRGESLPCLPAEYYDLFPDRLVDSELGEIPEGWEVKPFGTLLDDVIGGDWGKERQDSSSSEQVSIIRGTDLPSLSNGTDGSVPLRFTTQKKARRRMLQDGDIIIEVSGGSPTQPTGRSMLITRDILSRFPGVVVCASFCRRLRPCTWAKGLLAAQHLDFLDSIGKMWDYQLQSTGIANFQMKRFLEDEGLIYPGDILAAAFADLVGPMVRHTTRNESRTLSTLRDVLLPKLVSGEVRVWEVV